MWTSATWGWTTPPSLGEAEPLLASRPAVLCHIVQDLGPGRKPALAARSTSCCRRHVPLPSPPPLPLASGPPTCPPILLLHFLAGREEEDLKAGAVMKGTLEPGEGEERPQEGDLVRCALHGLAQVLLSSLGWVSHHMLLPASLSCLLQVFLHYSVMSEHKDVLASTDAAHGGSGHPQPFVLGKGRRMLRGMELGVMGACGRGSCWINGIRVASYRWWLLLWQAAEHLPLPALQKWRGASVRCWTSSPRTPSCTRTVACRCQRACVVRRQW